jgi:hypothetical protein
METTAATVESTAPTAAMEPAAPASVKATPTASGATTPGKC